MTCSDRYYDVRGDTDVDSAGGNGLPLRQSGFPPSFCGQSGHAHLSQGRSSFFPLVFPGLFSDREAVHRYNRECYDQLTDEQRGHFPRDYFQRNASFIEESSNLPTDLSPVVTAVTRALLQRKPWTSYCCGRRAGTWMKAAQFLPTPLLDLLSPTVIKGVLDFDG